MLLFILRYERPFFKFYFIWLAPRTGKIKQNKPAFWQLLHGSPICYQTCEDNFSRQSHGNKLNAVSYFNGTFNTYRGLSIFRDKFYLRRTKGFCPHYSLFHLFKTIDIHFASSTELQQLFSKLQAARLKQDFVTNEAFDRLRQKFKIWFYENLFWRSWHQKSSQSPSLCVETWAPELGPAPRSVRLCAEFEFSCENILD